MDEAGEAVGGIEEAVGDVAPCPPVSDGDSNMGGGTLSEPFHVSHDWVSERARFLYVRVVVDEPVQGPRSVLCSGRVHGVDEHGCLAPESTSTYDKKVAHRLEQR
jgi:hypothetical protein